MFRIYIRTLSGTLIALPFVQPTDTISHIKLQLFQEQQLVEHLFYAGKILSDSTTLSQHHIEPDATLIVMRRMRDPNEVDFQYGRFISEHVPQKYQTGVDIKRPNITIAFKPNERQRTLNLNWMKNMPEFCSKHCSSQCSNQNLWNRYVAIQLQQDGLNDDDNDNDMPSDTPPLDQRLVVLELRREFSRHEHNDKMGEYIDSVRYCYSGVNRSYYGGDDRSWQRYTNRLPVRGCVWVDQAKQKAGFEAEEELKPNTWYAVVLLHTNHLHLDPLFEDYLIPFKTRPVNG